MLNPSFHILPDLSRSLLRVPRGASLCGLQLTETCGLIGYGFQRVLFWTGYRFHQFLSGYHNTTLCIRYFPETSTQAEFHVLPSLWLLAIPAVKRVWGCVKSLKKGTKNLNSVLNSSKIRDLCLKHRGRTSLPEHLLSAPPPLGLRVLLTANTPLLVARWSRELPSISTLHIKPSTDPRLCSAVLQKPVNLTLTKHGKIANSPYWSSFNSRSIRCENQSYYLLVIWPFLFCYSRSCAMIKS